MAYTTISATPRKKRNSVLRVMDMVTANSFNALTGQETFEGFNAEFASVFGAESLFSADLSKETFAAVKDSFKRQDHLAKVGGSYTQARLDALRVALDIDGSEAFTMDNFKGQEQITKAANIVLNTANKLQTPAADELYKTIFVAYETEGLQMTVRAAGVGSYITGPSAWENMVKLTPIFGVLQTGDLFRENSLRIYPNFPTDTSNTTRQKFVSPTVMAPTPVTYLKGDAYGRQDHVTQYLAVPGVVENLIGLCTAPGQRPWTSTDDIESASITVESLLIQGKFNGSDFKAIVPTRAMSNITARPTSIGQSSNDRDANVSLKEVSVNLMEGTDGKAETAKDIFKPIYDKGYEPILSMTMNLRYNRLTYELETSTGKVFIRQLRKLNAPDAVSIEYGNATAEEKALLQLMQETTVTGFKPSMNLTNASNGNFGYRMEVYDAVKYLATNRREPVSIKYPVRPEDVNKEALDEAVANIGISIQLGCSRQAFERAYDHFGFLMQTNGAPVVDNNTGGEALPGRMYCKTAALRRSFKIADNISSVDNLGTFDNIASLLLNEMTDLTAALEQNSGISAVNEFSGIDKTKWSAIVHKNLARFLMRSGDARLAALQDYNIIATNFNSMIGRILLVPENDSTADRINPIAGVGVCVAKENIVLHGNVTRGDQDFGILMTMPVYRHWDLGVVMGEIYIEDAERFLDSNGIMRYLAGLKVSTRAGESIEMTVVNPKDKPVFTSEVTEPDEGN